jgi:KaiC/GvpD/RAD55 family RecA-like ATPase
MSDYTLGVKELDNAIEGIRKGSNILLIGPPMSGKEAILYHIMYHGAAINENAIITVSTRESGTQILERFRENKLTLPLSRIGIVDCITEKRVGAEDDNENIKIVSSPVDLTGIGVKISQFLDGFKKKNILKIQLHIDSLSAILMYSNIQTVFKFLHVFTGRIKIIGGMGIYVMEKGMHEKQKIAILKHLFDGMIEIESENDRNSIRVVGFSSKPTPYFEYEIEGAKVKIIGRR